VTFARGPIAPHPEQVTTTNCVCSLLNVATVRCVFAQNGHGRKSMLCIGVSFAEDKRNSCKVLAAPAAGPTDGRHRGCAVPGVGNRPSCTSCESQCRATVALRTNHRLSAKSVSNRISWRNGHRDRMCILSQIGNQF
jgi:hypothetical protein